MEYPILNTEYWILDIGYSIEDEELTPAATHPRIDDIGEPRTETVTEAEVHKISEIGRELSRAQQPFLRSQARSSNKQLIPNPRDTAERVEGESSKQPDSRSAEQAESVFAQVVQELKAGDRGEDRSPRLLHRDAKVELVDRARFRGLAEYRNRVVVEHRHANRISQR